MPNLLPDNPDSGTGDEEIASLDAAMDEWTDPAEEDQQNADNQDGGDEQTDPPADGENTDIDGQPGDDPEPGPDELTGGQFAPHTAKIRTPDGRVTTVAELLSGSMMQADYTQKATAVAQQRQALEAEQGRVKSLDSELQQQREVLMALAEVIGPREPDPSMVDTDLQGFVLMREAHSQFTAKLRDLRSQMDAHQARTQQDLTDAQQKTKEFHRQQLAAKDPSFTDPVKYAAFWNEAVEAGKYYGFSPEDLNSLVDHRHYLILRDALAHRRSKANAAKLQNGNGKHTGQQRPVITGSQRNPGGPDAQRKQAAQARFNKEPSLRNAVDLI